MKSPVQAGKSAVIETPPAALSPAVDAHLLIDSLPVMAWTMGHDGVLNFINQQWYAYTGCPRDLLPGLTNFVDFVHPKDRNVIYQMAMQLADKENVEFEFRMRRHDGEYRWCLARAAKVRDNAGQTIQWVGTTLDIDDIRRASDQEDHYQLALESADVGIWRLKLPSSELTVDERTRRHLDLDSNVILDYHPENHIHPQDYARSLTQEVRPQDGRHVTEHRVKQRDGTYRWQAINWRVYFDGEGANAAPALITGTSMDITPRKEAEAEREELGQRYRMALDTAELGTWSHDIPRGLVHLDARAQAHFGIDLATLNYEQCFACIHELDRERLAKAMRRRLNDLTITDRTTWEFRVRHPNGEVRWLSSQSQPAANEAGCPITRVIGVTRDITEMKLAEIKLRESEERLRRIAENLNDALWLMDPHTQTPLYVSPVYERLTGRSLAEELRDPDGAIQSVHPDDREYLAHLRAVRQHRGFTAEFRMIRADGSIIWVRNRTFPIYDDRGELIHMGGIVEDITQRKQFEESLRLERERFDRMVAVVPGVLYSYRRISSGMGQMLYVSPGLADIHGMTNDEIASDAMTIFRWVPPEEIAEARRTLEESVQNFTTWRADYRVFHPKKGLLWMSTTAVPIREADGTTTMHGFVIDITARKQAEEQVQRLNDDLELRVQQRTAELTAANQELESFAYAVSHDLRAPLRAMWGFCDVLIEDYGPTLPPEAREYLQHVIDGSRHLAEIVDGLLALSRSTRGALRRDSVDLSGVAEKIMRDMSRIEPARRITWAIQPALHTSGDSRMIDAVMRNLLGNAWKYTANRSDALIRVYSDIVEGEQFFCIEDNGAGFNMEHAEKLFQPFQRLHRQDEFNGLGIGLATVQRIIHRHGGKVYGIGAIGKGALFRFSLPTDEQLTNSTEKRDVNDEQDFAAG